MTPRLRARRGIASRAPVQHVQSSATGLERRLELVNAFPDESHAPVSIRAERVEDLGIEHEGAMHRLVHRQRRMQRSVVEIAQVAPEPDQGFAGRQRFISHVKLV